MAYKIISMKENEYTIVRENGKRTIDTGVDCYEHIITVNGHDDLINFLYEMKLLYQDMNK